ncbi:hypothetical protein JANAI62_13490 [Jannaschia pagri]|uniref:Transposase n=1 Tax=Jannaschia pagri TaxID=2829797 RepID=A0ABQ4NK60_9RHOB|nr:hypothetical protein JANAI61_13530 [Jannaschia sp. AI_61]GIT94726.1 hypothetical protein JANAI62_13490 [Jannaschia sp. AI_62]
MTKRRGAPERDTATAQKPLKQFYLTEQHVKTAHQGQRSRFKAYPVSAFVGFATETRIT